MNIRHDIVWPTLLGAVVAGLILFGMNYEAKADSHPAPACFKWDAPVGEEKACSHAGEQSVIVGVGWSDSTGSGMLQFKYRPKEHWDVFAMVWTDNNDNGTPAVATTTTTQTYRYRNRRRELSTTTTTVITPGDDGDTSNIAFGGAGCYDYSFLRGCLGAAYVANDDTENIRQHMQFYVEATAVLPDNPVVNRCGLYHLSDGGKSEESFVGCGKEW